MARILFIQPFDFPTFKGQEKRKRFFVSRSQFEIGYQVPQEHNFSVLDLNLAVRQNKSVFVAVKEAVCDFNPQLIFLTYPSFPQGEQVSLVLHCFSKIADIPVVIGGGAISLIEDAPLRWWPNMNIACCYNGFGNQVSNIIQNVAASMIQDIPGVFWVKQKPSEKTNPKEKLIDLYNPEDLYSARGRLDFPSYLESIRKHGFSPCMIIELTRGCLHRCSFCAINRENFGFFSRSYESVANEIEYLASLGIISFRFADPTFGLEKEKTNNLLEAMILARVKYPKIRFEITTRANIVSKENAQLFCRAGITRCDLGMETMSETDLASVRKDIKKERLQKAVRYLAEVGIETKLFHITFPGRISVPTLDFLVELSQDNIPFLIQSAYLRKIPDPQSLPLFSKQDQKVFCEEDDSIEQIMEWVLVNLAFRSTNTFFHEPWFHEKLCDALSRGVDPKTFFEISQSTGETILKLKAEFDGRKYTFVHTKKTPFMWCLKRGS
jgi:hypothetical protein